MTEPEKRAHPADSLVTLRDMVRWGASEFGRHGLVFGHGTDNALDEALQLVLHACHLDYTLPGEYLDCRVTESEKRAIQSLFEERISSRVPAPYLTGKAWFAGLEFEITRDVLVPRSPIGELILNHFDPWIEYDRVGRILDLCTGSGCIGIASAAQFPDAEVDLVDISREALQVARRNVEKHHLEEQVSIIESDLFDEVPRDRRYDLILSNPPYVSREEYNSLPGEYLHEPRIGLEAGEDGMEIVARILARAGSYLAPGGIMIVEVGASAEFLLERFPGYPFMWLDFEHGGDGVFLLTREQLAGMQ
ncbi:MAG: 50S ribosomal protein L3 N(5)-glutamine methyltransferase [Sedimenticolaceae bacterium]|nr:50S ribosomal protein L3 N(5)-glutamine methyltransferase [Sedimenticolaceae bacterium]